MIVDTIAYFKTEDGQAVRVGDLGKTVFRQLPEGAEASDLEPFFLYTCDPPVAVPDTTEITSIQVEPAPTKTPEEMSEGESIVFGTGDLL